MAPFPRPPFPPWLLFTFWCLGWAAVTLVAVSLLTGCGAGDGLRNAVDDLDEETRDLAQGCDWRASGPIAYEGRDPAACYEVFPWIGSRLSTRELADPCEAAELGSPVVYRPGDTLWGYYDRSELEKADILRNSRLDSCPP